MYNINYISFFIQSIPALLYLNASISLLVCLVLSINHLPYFSFLKWFKLAILSILFVEIPNILPAFSVM